MTAFDTAWRRNIVKAEAGQMWYSVSITPRDEREAEMVSMLENQLFSEGISFDTGGMIGGGRDWELDHSLRGATPDEVLMRLKELGVPFEPEMWFRTPEEEELLNLEMQDMMSRRDDRMRAMAGDYEPKELHDKPHPFEAFGVGAPMKCPSCGEDAGMIREGWDYGKGGGLNFVCGACGHMESADEDPWRAQNVDEHGWEIDPWSMDDWGDDW